MTVTVTVTVIMQRASPHHVPSGYVAKINIPWPWPWPWSLSLEGTRLARVVTTWRGHTSLRLRRYDSSPEEIRPFTWGDTTLHLRRYDSSPEEIRLFTWGDTTLRLRRYDPSPEEIRLFTWGDTTPWPFLDQKRWTLFKFNLNFFTKCRKLDTETYNLQ